MSHVINATAAGIYTAKTAGKFVDQNIDFVVPAAKTGVDENGKPVISSAGWMGPDDAISVTSGAASVNPLVVTENAQSIVFENGVIKSKFSTEENLNATVSTEGWIENVTPSKATINVNGSISPVELEPNLAASNIKAGVTIFGIPGSLTGADLSDDIPDSSIVINGKNITIGVGKIPETISTAVKTGNELNNEAKEGVSYVDTTASAPALIEGQYLYLEEGYYDAQKISLAKLVPDGTTVGTSTESPLIYKSVTVRNDDGSIVTGTMQDAELSTEGSVKVNTTNPSVSFAKGVSASDDSWNITGVLSEAPATGDYLTIQPTATPVKGSATASGSASVDVSTVGYLKDFTSPLDINMSNDTKDVEVSLGAIPAAYISIYNGEMEFTQA